MYRPADFNPKLHGNQEDSYRRAQADYDQGVLDAAAGVSYYANCFAPTSWWQIGWLEQMGKI
jgi:hypothetical protein